MPSKCQIVWIQIRRDNLSGLVWVQTFCKSHQATTLEAKSQSKATIFNLISLLHIFFQKFISCLEKSVPMSWVMVKPADKYSHGIIYPYTGLKKKIWTYSSFRASGLNFSLVLTPVKLVLKSGILKETKHIIQ